MRKLLSTFLAIIIVLSLSASGAHIAQAEKSNANEKLLNIKNDQKFFLANLFSNIFFHSTFHFDTLISYVELAIADKNNTNEADMPEDRNSILKEFVNSEDITINILAIEKNADIFYWPMELIKRKYPNITIEMRIVSNEETMQNELLSAKSKGKMPDIFMIKDGWIDEYWSLISPAPRELFTVEDIKKDYFSMISDVFCTETRVWAIPIFIDSLVIFYNSDLLKDGRVALASKPADNWEGLRVQLGNFKQLAEKNKIFFSLDQQDSFKMTFELFKSLVLQSAITTEEKVGDKEKIEKILQFLMFFYEKSANKKTNLEQFSSGDMAIIFGNNDMSKDIRNILSENMRNNAVGKLNEKNFNISLLPQTNKDEKTVTLGESWGFAVYSRSENINTSWVIIDFLTSEEIVKDFVLKTGKTPARIKLANGIFAESANLAESAKKWSGYEFKKVFEENFTNLVNKKSTTEEVIENFYNFFQSKP